MDSIIEDLTLLTLLELSHEGNLHCMSAEDRAAIVERVRYLRIEPFVDYDQDHDFLMEIIENSQVLERLTLDGTQFYEADEAEDEDLMRLAKAACSIRGVDLWRENFPHGNGRVDLNS
jgi:hypothetical protein